MNDTIELLLNRRSHRKFNPNRSIDIELLSDIVRCGCSAPSSKNAQPWRFHVVTDIAVRSRLANAVEYSEGAGAYAPRDPKNGMLRKWKSTVAASAEILRLASACIFVENRAAFSGGRATLATAARSLLPDVLVGYTLEVLGIGMAIQNMVTAANALGVQCVYMGDVLIAESAIKAKAELAMEGDLLGVLALGYSTESLPPRESIDPAEPHRAVWHDQQPPPSTAESPTT